MLYIYISEFSNCIMFCCPLRAKFVTLTLEPFRSMILLTLQSHSISNKSALTDHFQHLLMFLFRFIVTGGRHKNS